MTLKSKNKIISALLCLSFVASFFSGCGNNSTSVTQTQGAVQAPVTSVSEEADITSKTQAATSAAKAEPEKAISEATARPGETTAEVTTRCEETTVATTSKTAVTTTSNTTKHEETTTAEPEETTVATTSKTAVTTTTTTSNITKHEETTIAKPKIDYTFPELEASVDFYKVYEAEDAFHTGKIKVGSENGTDYAECFEEDADTVVFSVDIPANGLYKITITSNGIGSDKVNNVLLDGSQIGTFNSTIGVMDDYTLSNINLTKGSHEITITKSWGWIKLDKITIESTKGLNESDFEITSKLINKNATTETKKLFEFLSKCFGRVTLSGQVYDRDEFDAIYAVTGKYPAIMGLDMSNYTPSRVELGTTCNAVETAIEHDRNGGIVTFCWHWNAPTEYLLEGTTDAGEPRWWYGFNTHHSGFDIEKVMNGKDKSGKAALDRDIKEIAKQLKRLEENEVPVLWRPLHEASGGWFWWGAKGPDVYKKLWIYLYNELTNTYGCNNLIWVWNGQHKDWYPGDEYVDIIGEDIYPGKREYYSQAPKFGEAMSYTDENKIVAMSENGCVYDVDSGYASGARWAWFCTWYGYFVVQNGKYSEEYTEKSMLKKVYDSKYVITLDELPDFKK